MIPNTIHPDTKSTAERRLFEVIRSALRTDKWVCLHSLGLSRHASKRRGEIDFLLLTPLGIFVLEVKGGRVSRDGGLWTYTNRYGQFLQKHESPFDQASSAMFCLERDIKAEFGKNDRLSKLLFGYGVLFPDVEFSAAGCEADQYLVYDSRDRQLPFDAFINRLSKFARDRDPVSRFSPSSHDIERLTKFLRGDFDLVPSLSVLMDTAAESLIKLTDEQYTVLDTIDSLDRVVVQGGAGTGKTLLAIEAAKRESRQEKKTLFLCYNRLLAAFLKKTIAQDQSRAFITVDSVYGFMQEAIRRSTLAEEFDRKRHNANLNELYSSLYPEYAAHAIAAGAIESYDAVVIDEAQDMMTDAVLDVVDIAIRSGLTNGRWRLFCDVNNQGAVYGAFDAEAFSRLSRTGTSTFLTTNRRNTRQIADNTTLLSLPRVRSVSHTDGIPVQFGFYEATTDQIRKLERLFASIDKEGVARGRVTVLSAKALADSWLETSAASIPLDKVDESNVLDVVQGRAPQATYSTISAFKGLENDFVIISDIDDITSEWWRAVVYVGMSRARLGLHLFMNRTQETAYHRCLETWLQKHPA